MQRVLYLVRHAEAASSYSSGGSDWERPLTSNGREAFRELAAGVDSEAAIEFIYHSPRRRAAETAQILGDVVSLTDDRSETIEWLNDAFLFDQLRELLQKSIHERLAVVGHEPSMSRMANQLCGRNDVRFSPGSVAIIELHESCGEGRCVLRSLVHCRR